jgi:hypothetical protein
VNASIADAQAVGTITNDDVAAPWEHTGMPLDVSGDGNVTALDALQVINALNASGARPLPPPSAGSSPPPYLDASGDNNLTALDGLLVINELNSASGIALAAQDLAISLSFSQAAATPNDKPWWKIRALALDGRQP